MEKGGPGHAGGGHVNGGKPRPGGGLGGEHEQSGAVPLTLPSWITFMCLLVLLLACGNFLGYHARVAMQESSRQDCKARIKA